MRAMEKHKRRGEDGGERITRGGRGEEERYDAKNKTGGDKRQRGGRIKKRSRFTVRRSGGEEDIAIRWGGGDRQTAKKKRKANNKR